MKDNINPDHYKNSTSLECIEAMEIMFGENAIIHFCLCNAYKYIWRHKNKNGKEDLKKAKWYLDKAKNILHSHSDYVNEYFNYIDRMLDYLDKNLEE